MPAMSRTLPALVALSALLAVTAPRAEAQQDVRRALPRWTVLGGIGNAMGQLGVQVEYHLAERSLSAFGGVGYTPELDDGRPTGMTGAAGIRGFVGARHRGFVEVSVSQVLVVNQRGPGPDTLHRDRYYGPGVQLGYQFISAKGITVLASAGGGYAVGVDDIVKVTDVQLMFGLGIGYTWR